MKVSKKILAFLFSIVLFDFIGLTILITVQTFIVKEYNTTALAVTLLTVIYAAAQFIAAPLLGKLSDRYGRRQYYYSPYLDLLLVISFLV